MTSLDNTIVAIRLFKEIDSKMPLDAALIFIEIAKANLEDRKVTIQSVRDTFGVTYRNAATRVYYLEKGNKRSPHGGHRLVSVDIGVENHRDRVISLTKKGRDLVSKIQESYDLLYAA